MICAYHIQSSAQGLDGESSGVLLARGQGSERARNILFRESRSIRNQHPIQHLREHGAASERRRATISQKAHGFYPAITHAQRQA